MPLIQTVVGTGGTTATPTTTLTVQRAGDGLIAYLTWRTASGSVSSISDTGGGSWVQVSGAFGQGNSISTDIWYRLGVPAGAITVTGHLSASQTSVAMIVSEWGAIAASEGGKSGTGSTGTSVTSAALTTVGSSDILVASARGQTYSTPPAPWTADPTAGNGVEYQTGVVAGSYSAHLTQATGAWTVSLAGFKAGLGVADPNPSSLRSAGVTLNSSIVTLGPGGNATIQGFNWGLTTAYGNVASASGSFGTGAFSQSLTGLTAGTTYHYQAFSTSPDGTTVTGDFTFTVPSTPTKGEVLYNGAELSGGTITSGSLANLFNGDYTNGMLLASSGWAGITCGSGVTANLTRVRMSHYTGFGASIPGNTIDGSLSDSAFGSPDTLFTVPSGDTTIGTIVSTGSLTNEYLISSPNYYQYFRWRDPVSWAVYDVDFIGTYQAGISAAAVAPDCSPRGGNFDLPTRVRLSSITTDATIYYTLDGSTPTTSSTQYTGPILISSDTEISAIAVSPGLTNSRISEFYFWISSKLFAHEYRYDNRGYRMGQIDGSVFRDPVSGYWYETIRCQDWNIDALPFTPNVKLGHHLYKSADLRNWKYIGRFGGDVAANTAQWGARAQILYCSATNSYVAWTKTADASNNTGLNVFTAPSPEGPWTYVTIYTVLNPMADGFITSGMTTNTIGDHSTFVDPNDGKVYLVYSFNNNTRSAWSQLDPTNLTNTLGVGVNSANHPNIGEAYSMFFRNGTYYCIASGDTSWNYNPNLYFTASTPIGPFTQIGNPFDTVTGSVGDPSTSYNSQTDKVIQIPGRDDGSGHGAFYYTGDDNRPSDNTRRNAYKVHVPMSFVGTALHITWQLGHTGFDGNADSAWSLDTLMPTVSGAPAAAT
jgi:hypothetical protein